MITELMEDNTNEKTKGGVILSEIKEGDILYECEHGVNFKTIVITTPERKIDSEGDAQWMWKGKATDGTIIDFLVTPKYSHYGPALYHKPQYYETK